MNYILVPIDFTENTDRALAAAKLLAVKESTTLLILHAYQPHIPDMTVPSGAGMLPVSPELEASFRKRLNEIVATTQSEGFKVEGLWALGGIHPAVFEAIEQREPDLVVLGRTGTGGFLDRLFGSSATRIGLDATCPVLIIPPQSNPKKFKEIVYATQLEYDENDVLRQAFPLFTRLGARVTFYKADSPSQPNVQSDQQFIEQMKAEFPISDDDIVIKETDSVVHGIEEYCDEIQADMMVMSARHHSFIEALITNPSVTKKMIIDTHIPLLIYHIDD